MDGTRPNILVVIVDCLRWDRGTGAAGGAAIPHLTALRESGTSFDTTIATVSCTSPSVASILTGVYPPAHGILSLRGYRLKKGVETLATRLKEAGYHCRAEVSGPLLPALGLDRGFDEYRYRGRSRTIYSPFGDEVLDLVSGGMPKPWFLLLHIWALHTPRRILRRFRGREYGEYQYDRAVSSIDTYVGRLVSALDRERTIVALTGDHGERLQEIDFLRPAYRYVSRIRRLDPFWDSFRLWRQNRAPKILKRFYRIKGAGAYHGFHVYDFLVKVPLLLSGAPFPAGLRVPDQVRHVDMLPTLLDGAGVGDLVPRGIAGRSLLARTRGEELAVVPAYMEASGKNLRSEENWVAGIRTPRYKYARRMSGDDPKEELYDLLADPREGENLADRRPDALEEMRRYYDEAREGGGEAEQMSEEDLTILEGHLRDLGYME